MILCTTRVGCQRTARFRGGTLGGGTWGMVSRGPQGGTDVHAWDIRPSLDVLLADLDLGLEYKHMASFVGISKHFTYFTFSHQPVVKSCSPKEMQTCSKSRQIRMFLESLTVTIFYPFLYFHPIAVELTLRSRSRSAAAKAWPAILTRLQKDWCAVIPVWSEMVSRCEKNPGNELLWWVELLHVWVQFSDGCGTPRSVFRILPSCDENFKNHKNLKARKNTKIGKGMCQRSSTATERNRPKSAAWCRLDMDRSRKVVFYLWKCPLWESLI